MFVPNAAAAGTCRCRGPGRMFYTFKVTFNRVCFCVPDSSRQVKGCMAAAGALWQQTPSECSGTPTAIHRLQVGAYRRCCP
jgi:hypothetical protein